MRTLAILLCVGASASVYAQPATPASTPPPDQTTPPPGPVEASPALPAPPTAPSISPTPVVAVAVVEDDRNAETGVIVGAKVGGIVPFDGLSPFVSFGLELGYALPAANHRLAIAIDVDYTQPTKTGSESDPRVTGGMYNWKLTEQELAVMPVLLFRMTDMKGIVPFAGIGPRVLLARSTVQDNGSPAIMETHEQSTRIGVGVPLGVELAAGPGRLVGELLLQYGTLNHTATGDANTGAASLSVGYRMIF